MMLKRLARLFTIKTRFEAFLVIYAIAVGAVERGQHYLQQYPGTLGALLALCCTGVVFLAGGKLLDSVRPQPVPQTQTTWSWLPLRRPQTPGPPELRRSILSSSALLGVYRCLQFDVDGSVLLSRIRHSEHPRHGITSRTG